MKGTTTLPSAVQTQNPSNDPLYAAIAEGQGFELYQHYTEAQAAKFIGIHAATLKNIRLKGGASFIRLGKRRIAYFGVHIAEYLVTQIQSCQPTKNVNINLVTTGLVKEAARPLTTERGLIQNVGRPEELHSALRTLRKPESY